MLDVNKFIADKEAKSKYPIIDIIKKRWSPRAFSTKEVSKKDIHTIFEAASWAASGNNEQPWEYFYATRGSKGFQQLWDCLMPGNQPWAKDAAVLVAAVALKTIANTGAPNLTAVHDLGLANSNLLLQATSMDIYAHCMAGFVKTKLQKTLNLSKDEEPVCMIALGYLGNAEDLEEPYKTREYSKRVRKPLTDFLKEV